MSEEQFQRDRICYEQNSEYARNLNNQMNRVPVLAMTLTGGLWFAAGVTADLNIEIRFGLLIFAGCCNLALIAAALRIRDVLHSYLEKLSEFNPKSFASGRPKKPKVPRLREYSMIGIYCVLMGVGSLLSFGGALGYYWPFDGGLCIGVSVIILTIAIWLLTLFKLGKKVQVETDAE